MATVLGLLGVLGVLLGTTVLVTRGDPLLADAPPDRADLALPEGPLQPDDVEGVRFSLAVRGYRMSEVDEVLARLAAERADRDRRLAALVQASGDEQPATEQPATGQPSTGQRAAGQPSAE